MAAADPKHGERLRADNYAYFSEAVRPLVGGGDGLPGGRSHAQVLAPYLVQSEARQVRPRHATRPGLPGGEGEGEAWAMR